MGFVRRQKYTGEGFNINKSNKTLNLNLDIKTLDLLCCYVISENKFIRRSHLINLRNMMSILDNELYIDNKDKMERIRFINKGLDGKLNKSIKTPDLLLKYINGGIIDTSILDPNNMKYELSTQELDWINETVTSALNYTFVYNNIDRLINVATKFKTADHSSKSAICIELESLLTEFLVEFRRNRALSFNDMRFTLFGEEFNDVMKEVYDQITNPSARLYTGMQGLNSILGGGLENGRCYMFLGPSGSFKSGLLLSLAYQIKLCNKFIKLKDPSKRPAIVILTMENTVKETIQRLFAMSTVDEDIKQYSIEEIIQMLRTQGELYISDENPIDIIIKYKPNGSVDTGYLYTLVEELEDEGIETICMIQDYVRRIRSAYRQPDIRLELGEIVNEFKVFASIKDIPLITAGQLNRDAARVIETASHAKKADIVKLLGRSNIGESMLMLDNLDWAGLIAIESDINGHKHLGINAIKSRIKFADRHIIYQPFEVDNNMRLVIDINSPVPVFKESLRTDSAMTMNSSRIGNNIGGRIGIIQSNEEFKTIIDEKIKDNINIFEKNIDDFDISKEFDNSDLTPEEIEEYEQLKSIVYAIPVYKIESGGLYH